MGHLALSLDGATRQQARLKGLGFLLFKQGRLALMA